MNGEKLNSFASRVFFFGAFLLLGIAVVDRFANFFGGTILSGGYTSGRILEFAAIMLIFVVALLLRQIREDLRRKTP